MNIKQLQELIMKQAKEKGFGTKPKEINLAEKIALIHTETSEAFDAYRHNNIENKNGFKEELGDIIQRTLHLCGIFNIDVEKEILKKIKHNKTRDWKWDKTNKTHTNY